MSKERKIALLIDVDNVKVSREAMDELLDNLSQKGEVVYCKFYGYNDRKHIYLIDYINNYGYETAPFMRLKKRFSQLDNRIVVDALKLNYTKPEINAFCIVSGEGDLIPLLVELKSSGKVCIDVNTEYKELNTHLFDEHVFLRNINIDADTYVAKAKKTSQKQTVTKKTTVTTSAAPTYSAPAKKPEPVKVVQPVEEEYEDDYEEEEDNYNYNQTAKKVTTTTTTTTYQTTPSKSTVVEETYDDYEDEYEENGDNLSEILKDITTRYNKLDFTNDDNMSEKLRLIRDIENLIDRENSKGEGIYSANEDIRQIFTDLQDVVDDMKNAL